MNPFKWFGSSEATINDKGVDMVAANDIVIVITGQSGSAKSTMAKELISLHTPTKIDHLPCPENSMHPSKETCLYRAAIRTAGTSNPTQYVIIADCAGVDAEGGVLQGSKLDEWLKKRNKQIDLVLYTVDPRNRAASLKDDIRRLVAKNLLKKTVFVVRAFNWPSHIKNKDVVDSFEGVEDHGKKWEFFIRYQHPREQGVRLDDIWKEIYEKACEDHQPQGCLPRSCPKFFLSKRRSSPQGSGTFFPPLEGTPGVPLSEEDESDVDSDSVWEFKRKASVDGIPMTRTRPSDRSTQVQILPNRTLTRSPWDDFDAKPEERSRSGFPSRTSSSLEIPTPGRPVGRSVSAEPPQLPDDALAMDTMLSFYAPTTSHLRTPSGTIDTGISQSIELGRLSDPPDPLMQANLPAALADGGEKKKKSKKRMTLSEFLHKGSQASSSSSSLLIDLFAQSGAPEPLAGSDELLALRKPVMGILQVVACWPEPLSVSGIARVLDKEVDEVQTIIRGPMSFLFKFDPGDLSSTIMPCDTSLRDDLLDRLRSQEFYLPASEPTDKLYIEILSRQPPSDPSRSYSQEVLMGVLTMIVAWPVPLNVPQIASVLGVVPSLVENVISGPARALFTLDGSAHNVHLFGPMQDFLLDTGRAGEYLISNARLDTIFIQILSRQPPSDASRLYSPDVLMGVLSVVLALGGRVKVPQIASLLDIAPSLAESVIFGPARELFEVDGSGDVRFSIFSFKKFLQDAKRARRYFIPNDNLPDSILIRILSTQPSNPLHSYSRDVLMDVLTVLAVWSNGPPLTVPQIASSLDIDPDAVKGIVFGLPVFYLWDDGGISLFSEVSEFLQDADRAGEFYIPPNDLNPNYHSLRAKIKEIRYG